MGSNIFIHRLLIYPQLGKCDVEFRNGLNVVWSKDINENKHIESNLRNSVGKTTFVKFIDYLLGKSYFIVSIDAAKKNLFENKSLLAEVIFGNERFTVKRSVLEYEEIHVFSGWVLDDVLNETVKEKGEPLDLKGYRMFLTKKIYGENIIVNKKVYITHRNIMSYLIRDQFAGFVKYDSGLKEENAKTRRKRLEFLLGLISEKKEQLEQDIDGLDKKKGEYANERNILKKYFQLVSETNLSKLNKGKAINEKQIKDYETELANKDDLLIRLQTQNEECKNIKIEFNRKCVHIDDEIYMLNLKETDYNMASKDIENELFKIKNINLSIDIFSPFQFKRCPVYMKELKGEKVVCGYISENENKNEFKNMTEARKKILTFEKKDINEATNKMSSFVKELKIKKIVILKKLSENNELQKKTEADIEEQFDKVGDKIKDLKHKNDLIDKELVNFQYVDKLKGFIDEKNTQIAEKKEALESIIKSRAFELNDVFNKIVKYLTDNARCGMISIKDYTPAIYTLSGNMDKGSAMCNVAVIAFDLAMLEMSLKFNDIGEVYPKFLVHDSPKLHDIQIETYKRIMDYVTCMEVEYSSKEFQYILTTLDISDNVEKNKDTYIRLTLDNSGDGGKLFGCQVEID
ncbi:DUF2326 domain-containing protein [Clostridium estertheticum]|uniref:DUF2326 domain-containing protein n=1 Tax=Clostridium estertheticum TaxID=238834 RepID=UPI001C0B0A6B|nr:DUF2326 domain-containing protein [Clostridium estertheticum]MBU3072848.1 hypothetical protein [Clostridium estertheticum]MBU3163115.1 hypothetical protein [Clostridium estertheticum]